MTFEFNEVGLRDEVIAALQTVTSTRPNDALLASTKQWVTSFMGSLPAHLGIEVTGGYDATTQTFLLRVAVRKLAPRT
jgi:hypothetical protein